MKHTYWKAFAVWVTLLGVIMLLPVRCHAQTMNATLSGRVLDQSGASVPHARVALTQTETTFTRKFETGPEGLYSFPNLVPGHYTLRVIAGGFKVFEQTGIILRVSETARQDVNLVLGATTQTISVQSNASPLGYENGALRNSIPPSVMEDLPLQLSGGVRSAANFAALVPGVSTGAEKAETNISMSGGPAWGDAVILDGTSMVAGLFDSAGTGGFHDFNISPDAIQEISVTTTGYDVEYGNSTGGVVIAETKAGTDQLHGSLFEFNRNTSLNSRQYGIATIPKDIENEFGGTVGGPARLPGLWGPNHKTFFFVDLDAYREVGGATTSLETIPTTIERQGNFTDYTNTSGQIIPIYDPSTTASNPGYNSSKAISATNEPFLRTQFPGNIIPQSAPGFAYAQNWLKYLPPPTNANPFNNYESVPITSTAGDNRLDLRIDENIRNNDHIYATVHYDSSLPELATSLPVQIASESAKEPNYSIFDRLSWDHTFTPTLLSHTSVGYNNWKRGTEPLDAKYATTIPAIPGVASNATPPEISFGGNFNSISYAQMGTSIAGSALDTTSTPTYAINELVTWVKGKHDFKMGLEEESLEYNEHTGSNFSGLFSFATAETGLAGLTSGNPMASFEVGQVASASAYYCSVCSAYQRSHSWGVFWGDTWKIKPKLTVSYGIRWDYQSPLYEKYNNLSWMDPNVVNSGAGGLLGALVFAGTGRGSVSAGVNTPSLPFYHAFAPRLGFAYSPKPTWVIRAGGGLFFAPLFTNIGALITQAGFATTASFSATPYGQQPAFLLSNGVPVSTITLPPSYSPTYDNGRSVSYVDPSVGHPPYMGQWDLAIEHQFTKNFYVRGEYVGSKGTHLNDNLDPINVLNPSLLSTPLATELNQVFTSSETSLDGVSIPYSGWVQQMVGCSPTVGNALKPYPQFCGTGAAPITNTGNSHYNSFSLKVENRFSHGLWFLGSYTLSKQIESFDADDTRGADFQLTEAVSPYFRKRTMGISPTDVPQTLRLSLLYELPFGRGKRWLGSSGKLLNTVAGGWRVSTIYIANSGVPFFFTVSNCNISTLFADPCIPAVLPGANPFLQKLSNFDPAKGPLLNISAFEPDSSFLTGTYAGQGAFVSNLRQPGYQNQDISVMKEFTIKERVKFQLRGDFFNTWNWHSFSYTGRLNTADFVTAVGSSTFGDWNGTVSSPRVAQVAARLTF